MRGWADLMGSPGAVAPEGVEATTLPQRVMRGVGEAGGALPTFGLTAAGLAARGTGAAAQAGQTAIQTVAKSPLPALAAETAMGAGSGAGGFTAAKYFPDSPTAEFLGELAGGGLTGAAPALARRLPGVQLAARTGKAALLPFTKGGGTERASNRVQSLVADPERAVSRIMEDTPGNLSPAQKSGEPGLMALEREVASTSPARFEALEQQQADALQTMEDSLRELGEGGGAYDARDYLSSRRADLIERVQTRARQAAREAQQWLRRMTPQQRSSEASLVVREQIDKALADVSAEEDQLWRAVPKDAVVHTGNSRAVYGEIIAELPKAQQGDVPDIARRFLDPDAGNSRFGERETVNEVWGLRSKLLEIARQAKSRNANRQAKIAGDLGRALLKDLGAEAENIQGPAGEALRAALDYSKAKAVAFEQGAVGRLLETTPSGGQRIPDEAALAATVGRGGERGGRAVQDITNVTRETAPIRDFALEQFIRTTTRRGEFNVQAAKNWLADNRDVVDRIPWLRDEIDQVTTAHEAAALVARQAKRAGASLSNQRKSYTAAYLNADPSQEIQALVRSRNPSRAAREIVNQARKDPTGRALAGVKAALSEHLIDNTSLSGKSLAEYLNGRGMNAVVMQILGPDDLRSLRAITVGLDRLRAGRGPLPNIGSVINDTPSAILSTFARVLAAQQGRKVANAMGGGTVQTPGIFSNRAQQILSRLTQDKARDLLVASINDPDKMVNLLLRVDLKNRRQVQRLNAWLEGPVARILEDEEE
ncbi:MAG: hypothetical protein RIM84_07840 [Alphaproteobacteria bacterium]